MEKILIIEDDKTILMGLKDDLEFEGYKVSSAMDGKEGLKKAFDGNFHLIILKLIFNQV